MSSSIKPTDTSMPTPYLSRDKRGQENWYIYLGEVDKILMKVVPISIERPATDVVKIRNHMAKLPGNSGNHYTKAEGSGCGTLYLMVPQNKAGRCAFD